MESFDIDKKINLTFSDKWMWHLQRFALIGCIKNRKLWYHQPSIRVPMYSMTFGYDEDGVWGMSFKDENVYRVSRYTNNTQGSELYSEYEDALSSYSPRKSKAPTVEIVVRDLRSIFRVDAGEAMLTPSDFVGNRYYGILSPKDHTLETVIIFVEKN